MKSIELTNQEIKQFKDNTQHLRHEPPHQYESIRIKDGRIVLILYDSRKLVYNDNIETERLLKKIFDDKSFNNYQKTKKVKYNNHSNNHNNNQFYPSIDKDYQYIIGSDETGKGEWYGPLVVCAVSTSHDDILKLKTIGVTDSKNLNIKQIKQIYHKIEKIGIDHETIILRPFSYNNLYNKFKSEGKNLNHLLAYLHFKAINQLLKKISTTDVLIIIDKFDYKKTNEYLDINKKIDVIQETNGEKYIPVATSSIIAKYHYEKTLKEIEKRYNINLRKTKPKNINKDILNKVAKTHFKNVKPYLKKR